MTRDIDTTKTYGIAHAPAKLIGMLVGAIAFTAVCAFLAVKMGNSDDPRIIVVYGGIVFFGACSLIALSRLLTQRGHVVTISPEGIKDLRVASRIIPWSAIQGISTWSQSGQKIMVLAVDPAIEPTLELTRVARWSRKANKGLGADGLCIAASGLATSYDWMLETTIAYAAAAQQEGATA